MTEVAIQVGVVVWCLLCVAVTAVRLPGTWLILVAGFVLGWTSGWTQVTPFLLAILAFLAVTGEALELVVSTATAGRAGASRRAMWGGFIGGIVGMFVFGVPVPVVGPVVGAVLGCFAGSLLGEMLNRNKLAASARIGVFSAVGFALGSAAKVGVALCMAAILVGCVFGSGAQPDTRSSGAPSVVAPGVAATLSSGAADAGEASRVPYRPR